MKCPRKMYLVISKTSQDGAYTGDTFFTLREAKKEADHRNASSSFYKARDWRVETFVKGD